jgi:ribosomal protein S18 acetylase RimI-like enzyme
MFTIRAAIEGDMPAARAMFEDYAASIGIDLGFQDFAAELAGLPGAYAPPGGQIWFGEDLGRAVGCVAVRPLGEDACEMKRLFVRPAARGLGMGRLLARAAVDFGRARAYRVMRLDTLATMTAARALYISLGFREVPAYCYNPIADAVFMELALTG